MLVSFEFDGTGFSIIEYLKYCAASRVRGWNSAHSLGESFVECDNTMFQYLRLDILKTRSWKMAASSSTGQLEQAAVLMW